MGGGGGGQAQREEGGGGGHGGRPRWCSAAACELGGVGGGSACVWIIWSGLETREMNGVVHNLSWALERYGPRGLSKAGLLRFSLNPFFLTKIKP